MRILTAEERVRKYIKSISMVACPCGSKVANEQVKALHIRDCQVCKNLLFPSATNQEKEYILDGGEVREV